jgi:hypothetical protein
VTQAYDHLRTHQEIQYRYAQGLPLRDEEPSLLVNWCEVLVTRRADGKLLYHNAWVTDHDLDDQRVRQVVEAARSRWKTENENHNILKTKGYHLEHNFGHGHQYLSQTLLTLNTLAFLFHTVLQLVDSNYQAMRQKRGARQAFFQDIRTLTQYCLFESWQTLLDFMLTGEPKPYPLNSS